MFPYDHARTCTCPCPACIDLHRHVLAHMGMLDPDRPASHVFVFAHGALAVAELSAPELDHSVFYGLYQRICSEKQVREPIPIASFGWLIPTCNDSTLAVVCAPSNPYGHIADAALDNWATENGHRLTGVPTNDREGSLNRQQARARLTLVMRLMEKDGIEPELASWGGAGDLVPVR
jgi:hypothetical protein